MSTIIKSIKSETSNNNHPFAYTQQDTKYSPRIDTNFSLKQYNGRTILTSTLSTWMITHPMTQPIKYLNTSTQPTPG
jgi:hypothetical protein